MRGCAPNHKHSIFITSHIQQHILRSLKSVSFTPACAEFHFTSHDVLISLITRGIHSHPFEANQAHKHNFKKICERAACVRTALWNWQTHISEFNIQVYQFHGRCGLCGKCASALNLWEECRQSDPVAKRKGSQRSRQEQRHGATFGGGGGFLSCKEAQTQRSHSRLLEQYVGLSASQKQFSLIV